MPLDSAEAAAAWRAEHDRRDRGAAYAIEDADQAEDERVLQDVVKAARAFLARWKARGHFKKASEEDWAGQILDTCQEYENLTGMKAGLTAEERWEREN